MTAAEIVNLLQKETPPIVVSVRTVERDFIAIRDDVQRYLTANKFDARFEVGAARARHELIARTATKHTLTASAETPRTDFLAFRHSRPRPGSSLDSPHVRQ